MPLNEEASALKPLISKPRRLLAIFPHPDDESYGPAGTLYRNASRDDTAVAVYTMTRGEASSMGKERGISPDEVAAIRRERLEIVDKALGLDVLLTGSFPDSGMAHTPLADMAGAIGDAIDAMQPQVIIAHDPRGVNAHADHIAAHWAIRTALLTRPNVRLAMVAYLQELADQIAPRLMFPTPEDQIDCEIELTPDEVAVKQTCLEAHDAIVTMNEDEESEKMVRPPIERFSFFRETVRPVVSDLFDQALSPGL